MINHSDHQSNPIINDITGCRVSFCNPCPCKKNEKTRPLEAEITIIRFIRLPVVCSDPSQDIHAGSASNTFQ